MTTDTNLYPIRLDTVGYDKRYTLYPNGEISRLDNIAREFDAIRQAKKRKKSSVTQNI